MLLMNELLLLLLSSLLLLLLLSSKHIFGFHKIQIWFFTLELKNKNEKYLKSRKISKNLETLEKTRKISKRKTHQLMAGETAHRNTK